MPLQVTILPIYIGLRDMGFINTRWGIILPAIFSPFGVVVMRQYMHGINNSVIEAMRIETNSIVRIIVSAVIPQMKICIFAVNLFRKARTLPLSGLHRLILRLTQLLQAEKKSQLTKNVSPYLKVSLTAAKFI